MARNYRYKILPSIHDSRLGPYDVLCGRTSHAYNNVGNRRFRVTIRMHLQRYQALQSRADRKVFIFYLTKLCRDEIGFRFLREEGGDFHDIGEQETRKKIGHALLDQTVKYPIQNPTTEAVENISSPQMLKHKVKPAKKKLKSILKKSKRAIQSRVVSTAATSTSGEQMLVRRVSLPSEPSPERGCKKAKKSRLSTIHSDGVTELESEVCMFLVGLQKQAPGPNSPQFVVI